MKLSVVIVNYNVEHFLEQCLYSVRRAMQGIEGEVFVVDNNSVDGSLKMLAAKFPEVKVIANKDNVGFAKANNQAIRISEGEYVLLLNPHIFAMKETLTVRLTPYRPGLGTIMHRQTRGQALTSLDGRYRFFIGDLPSAQRLRGCRRRRRESDIWGAGLCLLYL